MTTVASAPDRGLTAAEVRARTERGQTNAVAERTSRGVADILRANLLTRFNLILAVLLAVILAFGARQDSLFGIVPAANALIGIVQELRAKRTLDRLAVLSAPRAVAIRDGAPVETAVGDVVLDDLLEIRSGDEIVADGVVRDASGLQLDESLLTGEADAVEKRPGDTVMSGSFAVAGSGRFTTTAVGAGAYARRLTAEARRFTVVRSELRDGIDRILSYASWALMPAAVLLLISQRQVDVQLSDAVGGTVAALVAMVPQGLVLLTSLTFAVAAVTLAKRRVLVQELPAVEGLARVDVVCFDKTGTLTEGTIRLAGVELLGDASRAAATRVDAALAALAAGSAPNGTSRAIAAAFPTPPAWRLVAEVPFSSTRKWSAAEYDGEGTWVLGAPEVVLSGHGDGAVVARAATLAAEGRRVVLLAHSGSPLQDAALPRDVDGVALVLFEERLRDDARDTLAYFTAQGVSLKLISGDSPQTLAAVAQRVGIPDASPPVDGRELGDDSESLRTAVERHSVFGRVSPRQKQEMVRALQSNGHTVAMTGDGVNDVLALKAADLGVAMGSGAPASRGVAQLVLLDGRFATLPGVVAEGRRVTANIERVANLFVTKTVWATLLALAIGLARWPYPFLPRHLSVIDSLAIGIPAFFLALAPNTRRSIPGFVDRVLRFTIPVGLLVGIAIFTMFAVARGLHTSLSEQRTAATIVALALSLGVLVLLARPLTMWRLLLVAGALVVFVALFPVEPVSRFLDLETSRKLIVPCVAVAVVGLALVVAVGARRAAPPRNRG